MKRNSDNSAGRSAAPATSNSPLSIDQLNPHECVAALADSELSGSDAQVTLDRLLKSPELCASWHRLHQASDYLRSEEMAACDAGHAFWEGFSSRLQNEPTILAPNRSGVTWRRIWVRYALPGVSTVAAVAMIGWMVIPQYGRESGGAGSGVIASNAPASQQTRANVQPFARWERVAGGGAIEMSTGMTADIMSAATLAEAPRTPLAQSAELERYLGAHQQFSPRSVHGPVVLESASFSTIRAADVNYR